MKGPCLSWAAPALEKLFANALYPASAICIGRVVVFLRTLANLHYMIAFLLGVGFAGTSSNAWRALLRTTWVGNLLTDTQLYFILCGFAPGMCCDGGAACAPDFTLSRFICQGCVPTVSNYSQFVMKSMPMRAVSISVNCLLWLGAAHAGSGADNPSFMMVSGISASDEMCLTAADGARSRSDLYSECL